MDFSDKRTELEIKYIHDMTLSRIKTTHSMWIVSLGSIAAANAWCIKEGYYDVMFFSLLISIPFILSMSYQLGSIIYCRSYLVARYYENELCFDDTLFSQRVSVNMKYIRNSTDIGNKISLGTIEILSLPYIFYIAIDIAVWIRHLIRDEVTKNNLAAEASVMILCIVSLLVVLYYFRDRYSHQQFDTTLKFWKAHIEKKSKADSADTGIESEVSQRFERPTNI